MVRNAFRARGHDAWSCDLLDADPHSTYHIKSDVQEWLRATNTDDVHHGVWDLLIAHPPCQFLSVSGLHWNKRRPERAEQTEAAARFFMALWNAPIERVCIENPIGCMSRRFRKPDQIIQPWQFGHDASKATCLWLRGLPPLVPTNVLPGGRQARRANQTASGQNKLGPSPDRWKMRSITYSGIAAAMARQWG